MGSRTYPRHGGWLVRGPVPEGRRRSAAHQEGHVNNLSAPVDNGVNNFCGETGGYRVSSGSYSRWTGRKCLGVGHRRPPLGTQVGGRDGSWIDGRKACTGHYESGELRTDAEGSKDIHSGQRRLRRLPGRGQVRGWTCVSLVLPPWNRTCCAAAVRAQTPTFMRTRLHESRRAIFLSRECRMDPTRGHKSRPNPVPSRAKWGDQPLTAQEFGQAQCSLSGA